MSRGFVSALFGIAMLILSWYGPWEWPAWPAFGVIELTFGTEENFSELPFGQRAAFLVLLIVVNVASWGIVVYFASLIPRLRAGRVGSGSSN